MSLVLLPESDESPRCTDYARSISVDPGGTAIRADVLIAAELPLPWPKPVFEHELFAQLKVAADSAPRSTRVLAAVPARDDALSVVAFSRDGQTVSRQEWQTGPSELTQTVRALIDGQSPTEAELIATGSAVEVWICTQGSHDICCGADGTRLANEVADMWQDVVVRRVSHTGGHRFAPTAITLPDGRMWAHMEATDLQAVLTRTGDPGALAVRCRGWWGAERGPQQVAERCLLQIDGWAWESAPRSTELVDLTDGLSTVRVQAGEGAPRSWLVRVKVSREVPGVACRAPGGLPVKPGVEYEVLDIQEELS